jgi:hypothetical protein
MVAQGGHRRSPQTARHSRTRMVLTAYAALSPRRIRLVTVIGGLKVFRARLGRSKPPPT